MSENPTPRLLKRRNFIATATAVGVASASGQLNAMPLSLSSSKKNVVDYAPTVLIQDAINGCYYLIPKDKIENHEVAPQSCSDLGAETVTFVIPDDDLFEVVPPFIQDPEDNSSVLIQHPSRSICYLLSQRDLQKYKGPEGEGSPSSHHYDIAFVLPVPLGLIQILPNPIRGLLQSNTIDEGVHGWA